MVKPQILLEGIISYISKPDVLRNVFLVFISFFILYNVLFLVRFLYNKYFKKSIEEFERIHVLNPRYRIPRFFKKCTGYVLGSAIIIIIINTLLFLGVGATFAAIAVPQPKVIFPTEPSLGITEITDKNPLEIKFDRPINTEDLVYELTPAIEGDWDFVNDRFGVYPSLLRFTPRESAKSEERYTVSIRNITNILGRKSENYLFSFQTPPAPKVISVKPVSGDQGVLPSQEVSVETDYPHSNSADFSFQFTPELDFDVKYEGLIYKVKPREAFKKGTNYNLKVFRTLTNYDFKTKEKKALGEKVEMYSGDFKTIDAPGVLDYSPKSSGVLVNNPIKITFRQDMEPTSTQSAFSISPKVDGDFSWENPRTLVFKSKADLAKNTKYTVGVSKAAKAKDASPFEEEFSFSFTTIGYVTASLSPAGGGVGVGGGRVTVSFNQSVDHASAEGKFSISPNIAGSFSWSGNAMYFNYSGLSYSSTYSANVASGVRSVYGLDSAQAFGTSFTTKSQSVTLNVPSNRQSYMYSCMAGAARQALAYRGVSVSEDTLLSQMGYDNTPFSGTWGDPNAVWGDPDNGVTGNINGASGGVSWGYGAHAGPTSRAISNYRSNEVKSGWTVQGIAQEIANGNPVIVYWVNGVWPSYVVNWKTPSGKVVRGVNGMHVQVVKGFTGTVDNPASFIVNDSGYGYPSRTFDVGTFKSKWSWFGNTGIIVR